jgi:hypothetical protein
MSGSEVIELALDRLASPAGLGERGQIRIGEGGEW